MARKSVFGKDRGTDASFIRERLDAFGGKVEDVLDSNVRGQSFSWGLVLLLAVAAYAIFNIVRVLIHLFN